MFAADPDGMAVAAGRSIAPTMGTRLHLSAVVRSRLVDRAGERLGRVDDVIVRLDGDGLPSVSGLKARVAGRQLFVPADRIAELRAGEVRLSRDILDLGRFERRVGEVLLAEDVLGRRLIDVGRARLVTARDIELTQEEGRWSVLGILPGRGGGVRRWLFGGGDHRDGEHLLPWDRLEAFVGHVPTSRLRIGPRRLARLHPAQIADLVEAASHEQGDEIIRAVGADRELEADVFEELDEDRRLELIRDRSDEQAAGLISRMAADAAADLIAELPQQRRAHVLELLPGVQQRHVRRLLGYNPQTAGGLMSPEFVSVPARATVQDGIRAVRESPCPDELLSHVLVVDDAGRLAGAVAIVELLRASPERPLSEVAAGEVQAVHPDADLPDVARLMSDFKLAALPVLDDAGRPVGLVTVDDVLELVIPGDWWRRHRSSRD